MNHRVVNNIVSLSIRVLIAALLPLRLVLQVSLIFEKQPLEALLVFGMIVGPATLLITDVAPVVLPFENAFLSLLRPHEATMRTVLVRAFPGHVLINSRRFPVLSCDS